MRKLYFAATIVASGLMFGCNNKTNTSTGTSSSTAAPSVTKAETPNYASAMAEEADKEAIAHIYGAGDTHDKIHGMATFTAATARSARR